MKLDRSLKHIQEPLHLVGDLDTIHSMQVQQKLDKTEQHQEHDKEPAGTRNVQDNEL